MSTTTDDCLAPSRHEQIEALLPWYATGALTPAETATVERHLAQCPACRVELEQCHVFATAVQHNADEIWQSSPSGFERLMTEIDRLEAKPTPPETRSLTLLQRLRDWLGATPNSVGWTLALESLAVAGLMVAVALPLLRPAPDYETLSSSAEQPASANPRLRVIFADAATMGEIQEILRSIDGGIVAGPTALGVYTVALPAGAHPEPTLAEVLTRLQGLDQIRLAEPVAGGGEP